MEESLDNLFKKEVSLDKLFKINKSLICKKDELRKNLFEKFNYCEFSEALLREEYNFFDKVSSIINDNEFDKLLKKYEKLSHIIYSIDELKKDY